MSTTKRIFSLLLALTLTFSICVLPAGASEASKKKYVYMGDSMSFNFGKRHDYTQSVNEIYYEQVGKAMGYTIYGETINDPEDPDQNVYQPFGLGGVRSTDIYYLLSDYAGDGYTQTVSYNYLKGSNCIADKAKAQQIIRETDVVSVMLGYSNLTVYGTKELGAIFTPDKKNGYGHDLSEIFTEEELARALPVVEKAWSAVKSSLDTASAKKIRNYWKENVTDQARESMISLLGEDTYKTLNTLVNAPSELYEFFLYFFASELIHFDRMIESILDLNPNAEIYVMGLFNPIQGFNLTLDSKGKVSLFDLGSVGDTIFGFINLYMQIFSPYSDRYYFVENADHLETFSDVWGYDVNLAAEFCHRMLFGNLDDFIGDPNINQDAYAAAEHLMPIMANKNISLNALISALSDKCLDMSEEALFDKCLKGDTPMTEGEKLALHIKSFSTLDGLFVHPTQKAHSEMGKKLITAMQKKKIDQKALTYHSLKFKESTMSSILDAATYSAVRKTAEKLLNIAASPSKLITQITDIVRKFRRTTAGIVCRG